MPYAIADAPGYFGAETAIRAVFTDFDAALADRGAGEAIYEVGYGTPVGRTLLGSMLPPRADRSAAAAPATTLDGVEGWHKGRKQVLAWYVEADGFGRVSGPHKNRHAAEAAQRNWIARYLATPRDPEEEARAALYDASYRR